jgi:hypothetical protein
LCILLLIRRCSFLLPLLENLQADDDGFAPVLGGGGEGSEQGEVGSGDKPVATYDDGSSDDAGVHQRSKHAALHVDAAEKGGSSSGGSDDAAGAPDAAYLGMARKSDGSLRRQQQSWSAADGGTHPQQQSTKQQQVRAAPAESLAEQEAIALQLLAAQKW